MAASRPPRTMREQGGGGGGGGEGRGGGGGREGPSALCVRDELSGVTHGAGETTVNERA